MPEELKDKEIGKSQFNNTENSQEQHGELKFTEILPEKITFFEKTFSRWEHRHITER